MNVKVIVTAIGVLAVLFMFLLFFAPIHDLSKDMTTAYINPATNNSTAVLTDNGTVEKFNTFKAGIGTGYFWIIAAVILVGGVTAIAIESGKGNG